MPKVTALIATYNGARYIGKAIDSALAQTVRDLEVVVVDDGSTDDTAAVVAQYTDPRIRYLYQANAGPSAARNTGLRNSTGEWIALLDCDDWWTPTKLEAQFARLAARPDAGLVYGSTVVVDLSGQVLGYHMTPANGEGYVLDQMLTSNLVSNSSAMVRRDVLEHVGAWDESVHYGEDWELWLRVAAEYPLAKVDEVVAYLLRRPDSQGSSADAMRDACIGFLEKAFATFGRKHRHLRRRAFAEVYYRSAMQFHDLNVKPAARRDLLHALRCNPFRLAAYRRLVRLAIQS